MTAAQPITFVNTGLPVILLCGLAALLPRPIAGRSTRRQADLVKAVVIVAAITLATGLVLFALIYVTSGVPVGAAMAKAPGATISFFLRRSALAAIAWAPILALTWYVLAQGVERRKGADQARRKDGT